VADIPSHARSGAATSVARDVAGLNTPSGPVLPAGSVRGRFALVRVRRSRLAVCAVLVLAAGVLRGGLAALFVIFTVLLLVDALVPLPGGTWSEADDHFRRLVGRRRQEARRRRVRGLGPERLDVLDDDAGWASTADRRALGVQAIAIGSITGTVEGFKARDFDRQFRPDRAAAEHWKRLWLAESHGAEMPPISVYRVGAVHYVRDGHHRVSVARDLERATIDAEVVELLRPGGD
jgi:hypothetical protein